MMKLLFTFTSLLALASASPVAISSKEINSLEKRDTEIIYLINCRRDVSCCTPQTHSSHIAVCSPTHFRGMVMLVRHILIAHVLFLVLPR